MCDRCLIPEKLYGRRVEVQTLLDAFERVAQGGSEMMLAAGFSGIGKTTVVHEVHKPIVRLRGYFIKGKVVWTALQQGLILPQNQLYKFYVDREAQEEPAPDLHIVNYHFCELPFFA